MGLNGKRVAIFVADIYEEKELWYPYYRMKEEGAELTVVGPGEGTYTGKHGVPAESDRSMALLGGYDAWKEAD